MLAAGALPRPRTVALLASVMLGICVGAAPGSRAGATNSTHSNSSSNPNTSSPYYVYWDQNEEEDVLGVPSGTQARLIPAWDANGQLCLLPDGSGRFVTGYNPTSPGNPGGNQPPMQPPVGEALWNRDGSFSGTTLYVGGPYMLPGQTVGGDIPPDPGGTFNNNGTFTGCVFDKKGDLFASDLGTAQGQFPPPDSGRLIEWFAPSYTSSCIIYGPNQGGVGVHHVDGTGGLRQPGDLAITDKGAVLLPVTGPSNRPFQGRVLKLSNFPRDPSACSADGTYARGRLHVRVFIHGRPGLMFPQSIAWDPGCGCWGVASTIGNPAIAWFDQHGHWLSQMGVVPGEDLSRVGGPPGYNPFGLAFAPDGTGYFIDIHISCTGFLQNCGPQDNGGRVMKIPAPNGLAGGPVAIAGNLNVPPSVTVCVPDLQNCPLPPGA